MLMKSLQLGLLSISQVFGKIKVFDGKLDHKSSCCILIAFLQSHTEYFNYAPYESAGVWSGSSLFTEVWNRSHTASSILPYTPANPPNSPWSPHPSHCPTLEETVDCDSQRILGEIFQNAPGCQLAAPVSPKNPSNPAPLATHSISTHRPT